MGIKKGTPEGPKDITASIAGGKSKKQQESNKPSKQAKPKTAVNPNYNPSTEMSESNPMPKPKVSKKAKK